VGEREMLNISFSMRALLDTLLSLVSCALHHHVQNRTTWRCLLVLATQGRARQRKNGLKTS